MEIQAAITQKYIKPALLTCWMLLLMLPAHYSLAQQNDTTSYFPFETGDIWVYDRCPESCGARIRVEIISDSTDTNNTRWLSARARKDYESIPDTVEFKVDSTGNVYMKPLYFADPPLLPTSSFSLAFNDTASVEELWIAHNNDSTVLVGKITDSTFQEIFKDTTQTKRIIYGDSVTVQNMNGNPEYIWAERWGIVKMEPGFIVKGSGGPYEYKIRGMLKDGVLFGDTTLVSVSTEEEVTNLPESISLHQNYPNPFNPSTTIRFDLRQAAEISLTIYDITGREVATLLNRQKMSAGRHQLEWNAGEASSGIYFYRLNVNGQQMTRKMTLIK